MLYLVRMNETQFWAYDDPDGTACGTPYPSAAAHLPYDHADEVCRQLSERGFASVVTNNRGDGITLEDLNENQPHVIESLLHPGLYFLRWENGRAVMTKRLDRAFRWSHEANLSSIRIVAEGLTAFGYRVGTLGLPDIDYGPDSPATALGNFWEDLWKKQQKFEDTATTQQ